MSKKSNNTKVELLCPLMKTPFETGIRNFSSVAKYFMYYAPNIDSCQASSITDEETAKNIINLLMDRANIKKEESFKKRLRNSPFERYGLDGDAICIRTPKMLCKQFASENELSCLLRHIRNSLAHGCLYIKKTRNENYIVLKDFDTSGKKKELSAVIVITFKIFSDWKAIIEEHIL